MVTRDTWYCIPHYPAHCLANVPRWVTTCVLKLIHNVLYKVTTQWLTSSLLAWFCGWFESMSWWAASCCLFFFFFRLTGSRGSVANECISWKEKETYSSNARVSNILACLCHLSCLAEKEARESGTRESNHHASHQFLVSYIGWQSVKDVHGHTLNQHKHSSDWLTRQWAE